MRTNGSKTDSEQQIDVLALLPVERQGAWLDACLLCGDGQDLLISQVAGPHEAAAVLRQQQCDLVAIWHEGRGTDVVAWWQQLSELTGMDGFVVLGMHVQEGWHIPLHAAGAIACLDMDQTDPLTLVNCLRVSAELVALRREKSEWHNERQVIKSREARDIDRLLEGQRKLLVRLDEMGAGPLTAPENAEGNAELPQYRVDIRSEADELAQRYGEYYFNTVRNYVFDEKQSLAALAVLAQHFARFGLASSSIMRIHLAAVTRLTAGGRVGSAKHCLAGADRFLMELMMRLVDGALADGASPNSVVAHSDAQAPLSPLAAA